MWGRPAFLTGLSGRKVNTCSKQSSEYEYFRLFLATEFLQQLLSPATNATTGQVNVRNVVMFQCKCANGRGHAFTVMP